MFSSSHMKLSERSKCVARALTCVFICIAAGCILGEMLLGKPLFPGNSTMNQLERVLEVTGRPTPEDIGSMKSPFAATMLDSLPAMRHKNLNEMFPTASPEAVDLIRRCLQVGAPLLVYLEYSRCKVLTLYSRYLCRAWVLIDSARCSILCAAVLGAGSFLYFAMHPHYYYCYYYCCYCALPLPLLLLPAPHSPTRATHFNAPAHRRVCIFS